MICQFIAAKISSPISKKKVLKAYLETSDQCKTPMQADMGPPESAAHYFDNLDLLIITLQCHPTPSWKFGWTKYESSPKSQLLLGNNSYFVQYVGTILPVLKVSLPSDDSEYVFWTGSGLRPLWFILCLILYNLFAKPI